MILCLPCSTQTLVTLMLADQSATAGMNLFGSIPCASEDCCSDGCATEAVCDATDGCSDDGCGESCSSLFGNCGNSSLLNLTSLLHKSDHCFDDFISPMTTCRLECSRRSIRKCKATGPPEHDGETLKQFAVARQKNISSRTRGADASSAYATP